MDIFVKFRENHGFSDVWPIPLDDLTSFIVYMFRKKLSHSTVSGYISGLSYFNKINNLEDNTQKFVVRKLIEGIKRLGGPNQKDTRLPITRDILEKLLRSLAVICKNGYETKLFMASFSLAFHGFMRVGEITVDCKNKQMHTVKFENIKLCDARLEVLLTSSKTDQFGSGTTIVISKQKNKNVCPVQIMANFIKVRPPYLGPLFCHFDGSPLTRYQFSALLKRSLSVIGIENNGFKSHSFRIGMATTCALEGHATVWIVGSSIIKHAFGEARGRPGGVNLGLQRMGVNIWWQGKCGGKVLDMKQQIRTMLKYEDPPTILVLHIGGNDIGEKSSKTLCELIRKQFSWMRQLMLDTVFVWSQIIPRSSWRYSDNINAMEKCRMRVNTSIASFLTKTDGCYLRYPDIKANELFLMKDGVHLTSLGNNIFLNTLQGGLEMIIRNLGINLTFPDCK
ncbi:unnamed protein product [Mytilus edulis]|uniref:Uncharacterized protein n=3 Tax=Mytilus TaxID=6548 RepID=A0A8S3QLR2_MYTED|nr:unnamed protein product [Mytilus edulis]